MRIQKLLPALALLVAALLISPAGFAQQRPRGKKGGPRNLPPPQNLQVLPKDISPQQLRGMMMRVSRALGVRCNFCHIPREFYKDDKEEKQVARAMIRMVQNIRQHADEFMPDGRVSKLSCWTCHRGSPHIEPPEQGR